MSEMFLLENSIK